MALQPRLVVRQFLRQVSQANVYLTTATSSAERIQEVGATSNRPRASSRQKLERTARSTLPSYANQSGKYNRRDDTTRSSWIKIEGIPPLSSLDDILISVWGVVRAEMETGIIDLDAGKSKTSDDQPPRLLSGIEAEKSILSAHLILSQQGRPVGWRIQFVNRSVAHAFLQSTRRNPFFCAWKEVRVREVKLRANDFVPVEFDDCWIRVENCPTSMPVDHVRHVFRRYDMSRDGPAVKPWEKSAACSKMYLIHFADPSWARAAVRELQGIVVDGHSLQLIQYPKQIR
mmetsp:Transcript_463/g.804  ORF Transcript_463/g.804 Transcript_463/m.804 type:complete len:287 (-) Transcript_463:352-1212(-)